MGNVPTPHPKLTYHFYEVWNVSGSVGRHDTWYWYREARAELLVFQLGASSPRGPQVKASSFKLTQPSWNQACLKLLREKSNHLTAHLGDWHAVRVRARVCVPLRTLRQARALGVREYVWGRVGWSEATVIVLGLFGDENTGFWLPRGRGKTQLAPVGANRQTLLSDLLSSEGRVWRLHAHPLTPQLHTQQGLGPSPRLPDIAPLSLLMSAALAFNKTFAHWCTCVWETAQENRRHSIPRCWS